MSSGNGGEGGAGGNLKQLPNSKTSLIVLTKEPRKFVFFQEREVPTPREGTEELAVQEDMESNRLLSRKKVKKKSL